MKKRRKSTNANVPAKGRLRDMADQLWSIAVRSDWNWKCAVCGGTPCEAHHLVPRQHEATRYDLRNGIALCSTHHQFDADLSPHQNAAGWMLWLSDNHALRCQWYNDTILYGEHRTFSGTKTANYYCDMIRCFQEYVEPDVWQKIVGVKFSKWLKEFKS